MRRVNPCDVIIATWKITKGRPWLVLWVDEERGEVCVVPCTTQGDYAAAIKTGHHQFKHVGSWAMIQPLNQAHRQVLAGTFTTAQRDRVAAQLNINLGITE